MYYHSLQINVGNKHKIQLVAKFEVLNIQLCLGYLVDFSKDFLFGKEEATIMFSCFVFVPILCISLTLNGEEHIRILNS